MNEFSFQTDASYELLVSGPALKRERPENVPPLEFNGLPEYVTSSEEGETDAEWDSGQQQQQQKEDGGHHSQDTQAPVEAGPHEQNYSQSMQYIENYYKKQQSGESHQNNH